MNTLEIGQQMIMPESVKSIGSIVMFWNPQNHGEIWMPDKMGAIMHLADVIGLNYETIKNYTWAQHNLLMKLHDNNNDKAAKIIAHNIELTNSDPVVHKLLVKTAANLVYKRKDDWGHEGLDWAELKLEVEDITRINYQIPVQHDRWVNQFHNELKGLHCTERNIRVFGATDTIYFWKIDRETTEMDLVSDK